MKQAQLSQAVQLTPENFDTLYPQTMRDKYWSLVEWSLENLFNATRDLAKVYRLLLEEASIETQMFSYHEHPFNVALDLAGGTPTDEMNRRYDEQEAWVLAQ